MQLAEVFGARVVDVAPQSIVIEMADSEAKIDGLLDVLRPYGVLEMVRTGRVAMSRGVGRGCRGLLARRPPSLKRKQAYRIQCRLRRTPEPNT